MSLSLLAILAIPLFLGPWTTHRTYEQVERRVKSAIAVDNAGILMGRAGRDSLEAWRKMELALKVAEPIHHAVHLCARTPGPNVAACAAQDQAWEALWETRLSILETTTHTAWRGAQIAAQAEGMRLGVSLSLRGYSDSPPVTRRSCPFCRGRFQLVWTDPPRPQWNADLESSGVLWAREPSGRWQYRLGLVGEGDHESKARDGSL